MKKAKPKPNRQGTKANPTPAKERRRMRVGEAATYMGLSRHMVRTLIHDGALPALVVSGSFLIEPRDIDAFLKVNQTGR